MHYTYLLINISTIALPLAFSFYPGIAFYKQWRAFFPAVFITTFFYACWDALFTHLGVWGFNNRYVAGIYLFNLPLEEIMFFICIPYACIFTLHCLNMVKPASWPLYGTEKYVTAAIIASLAAIALFNCTRLYTVSAFGFTALLLAIAKYISRVQWLSSFYFMYIVIQLPFFIVNGLLTGHWLQQPVVWYNNGQNLGIRLTTVPVEDIFYGMGLLLTANIFYQARVSNVKFVSLTAKQ